MATEKKERMTTPLGEAKWAHIFKPQEGYKKGDAPKFKIDVVFDPKDPAWKQFLDDLKKSMDGLETPMDKNSGQPMGKRSPLKREMDKDDKPTGRVFVSFHTGEQYPPKVFDKYGNEMDGTKMVGNGSKVKVAYIAQDYKSNAGFVGITYYLNAVQVKELVEYKGATADSYGFDAEPAPASSGSSAPNTPPPPEDDLPF